MFWISRVGIRMRKTGWLIGLLSLSCFLYAGNRIDIPLKMSVTYFMPTDNPTGSTPDPTDPNQFRATLTGNTLTVYTQQGQVSYVVIRSDFSEKHNEDYFYGLSFDSISCHISQKGEYNIYIGYWNTDFIGKLKVESVHLYDFNGKNYDCLLQESVLPPGMYILRMETNRGYTFEKIIQL